MPLYNKDKIVRLISEMRKALSNLRVLQGIEKGVFLNDPDKLASAKYHLIVAIESAIDICSHIISLNGYRAPEDYADAFGILAERGAFDKDFVNELKQMARFRNRLIHLYWEVNDELVYEILQTRLDDFKTFLDSIALFLKVDTL